METYRDMAASDPNEVQNASFARIAAIYDDGVTLIFDGMEEPTQKRYQTNAFVVFQPGDRVRIIKDSGTYVVEYPVGPPRRSFYADEAGFAQNAQSAETAGSATTAGYANGASYLYSQGNTSGVKIWLAYSGGKYYVAADGQGYTQIAP